MNFKQFCVSGNNINRPSKSAKPTKRMHQTRMHAANVGPDELCPGPKSLRSGGESSTAANMGPDVRGNSLSDSDRPVRYQFWAGTYIPIELREQELRHQAQVRLEMRGLHTKR